MRGHWAGIPMPLDGERLVVEPTYPHAEALAKMGGKHRNERDEAPDEGWRIRNKWYSLHHRCDIIIMERDGKIDWGKLPAFHHITYDISTLGCMDAWGIDQETKALELLCSMVSARQWKQYVLTGMFLESSKRSKIMYLFRRLKPTVALGTGAPKGGSGMRILAALCMHPIAYYEGSWAGAMCPTDDVIAHLALMRGDEKMFWRRCNQHPPYRPEAGL